MKRTNKTQKGKRKHKKSQKEEQSSIEFPFGILKNKALWQQYGKKFGVLAGETTTNVLILELLFIMFGISLDICKDACFPWEQPSQEGPFQKIMIHLFKGRKCFLPMFEMSEFYMEVVVSFFLMLL